MASPRVRFAQAFASVGKWGIHEWRRASVWDTLSQGGRRDYSAAGAGGTIALIKQLREQTGAPMKDVKAVLQQCDWDPEAAFTELRKKGLAAASKKAGRVAADGLLGFALKGRTAAVVEINSETDFVARNDLFQHLLSQVSKAALALPTEPTSSWEADLINIEALKEVKVQLSHAKLQGESTVQEAVAEVGSVMGENVRLRRGFKMSSSESGVLCSYLHSESQPGLARIVGMLTLEPEDASQTSPLSELQALGSSLTMHVVAQRPLFLSKDTVSSGALQRERDILRSQALASGKPEKFVEKMVDGRIRKYMEDVALLEQKYVLDENKTIKAVLNDFSKQMGGTYIIGRFLRMEVGEGIERAEKDFASEVAAQAA
jgi:translation elongation factor Ts